MVLLLVCWEWCRSWVAVQNTVSPAHLLSIIFHAGHYKIQACNTIYRYLIKSLFLLKPKLKVKFWVDWGMCITMHVIICCYVTDLRDVWNWRASLWLVGKERATPIRWDCEYPTSLSQSVNSLSWLPVTCLDLCSLSLSV